MNAATRTAVSTASRHAPKQQRRGIVSWMTNYPDKVMETKKIQMAGGTKLGEVNPTWLKQQGDAIPLAVGGILVSYGLVSCAMGHYKLATGKGKKS